MYVPTKDHPSDQVITTEKTNILLRYLHQQWDKKQSSSKKRDAGRSGLSQDDDTTTPRKRARADTSNTDGDSPWTTLGHECAQRLPSLFFLYFPTVRLGPTMFILKEGRVDAPWWMAETGCSSVAHCGAGMPKWRWIDSDESVQVQESVCSFLGSRERWVWVPFLSVFCSRHIDRQNSFCFSVRGVWTTTRNVQSKTTSLRVFLSLCMHCVSWELHWSTRIYFVTIAPNNPSVRQCSYGSRIGGVLAFRYFVCGSLFWD